MTTKVTIEVGENAKVPVQVIMTELTFNGDSQSCVVSMGPGESHLFYINQNRSLKVQELQLGAA